jgi:hypothetical protein
MFIVLIWITFILYLVISIIRLKEIKTYDNIFQNIANNLVAYYQVINEYFFKNSLDSTMKDDFNLTLVMNEDYISNNTFIKEIISKYLTNNDIVSFLGSILKNAPFKITLESFIVDEQNNSPDNSKMFNYQNIKPLIIFNIVVCSLVSTIVIIFFF